MEILQSIYGGIIQGIIFFPVVLSLALSYRLLKFPDISIEGTYALGSAMFATVLIATKSISLALLSSLIIGAIAGGITGILHSYLRINKFLAGILLITALYSVNMRVLGFGTKIATGKTINVSSNLSIISSGLLEVNSIPYLIVFAAISTIVFYMFYQSRFGIKIRGCGLNPTYASRIGYSSEIFLIIGLALNNSLAALSGIYFTVQNNFSDVKFGQGILIVALAALAIGERLVPQKRISVLLYVILSALLGSLFYQVLWAFALKLNIEASDLKILSALVVVVLFVLKQRKTAQDEF